MSNYSNPLLRDLFRPLQVPVKPKVFVSYHHANDQWYADQFGSLFHEQYQVLTDRSLTDCIDSDDCDYVYQRIRNEFITGTSCTVVLCGSESFSRKYVDWEIKATLDKQHGLLGVILPSCRRSLTGSPLVPDRLAANTNSGYAHWIPWTTSPQLMLVAVKTAREKAKSRWLIDNSAPMMSRNR